MDTFKDLNDQERAEFKQWARDNYKPGTDINIMWHPVVREECKEMNREHRQSLVKDLKEKYPEKLPSMVGVNGNAFALMGHFRMHARRAGWDVEDIEIVLDECQSKDYTHLVATLSNFTE